MCIVSTRFATGYTGFDLSTFLGHSPVVKFLEKQCFSSIYVDLKKLVISPSFSDMKIQIKDQTVYAHKFLVMLRLPMWNSLLDEVPHFIGKY